MRIIKHKNSQKEQRKRNLSLGPENRIKVFMSLNQIAYKLYNANPSNVILENRIMIITDKEVLTLFQKLNEHDVKYILVGGLAVIIHGYIRTTHDLDLWIKAEPDNKTKFSKALEEMGVAGADLLKRNPFIAGFTQINIGMENTFTLDLMDNLKAFKEENFDECFERSATFNFEGVPLRVIHLNDLIKEKSTNPRLKDKQDLQELKAIQKIKMGNTL